MQYTLSEDQVERARKIAHERLASVDWVVSHALDVGLDDMEVLDEPDDEGR